MKTRLLKLQAEAEELNQLQCYVPIAGKPVPSSHEPPRQWNQVPVTLINSGRKKGEGWGEKNDPKAKRREWQPGKPCTEHMEVMQARLTALALAKRLTTDQARAPYC